MKGNSLLKKNEDSNAENIDETIDKNLPMQIFEYLNLYAVGQIEYKKVLSMAVYRYLKYGITDPILIVGPSGSGKTFFIKLLEKCPALKPFNFQVLSADVSRLTPSGYQGEDASSILKMWTNTAIKNKIIKPRGIIYLDEVDKILTPNYDSHGKDSNALVQWQIMNYIQGDDKASVDTSKILFVLGGAFTALDELEREMKKSNVGFNSCSTLANYDEPLRDKLQKIGTQKEFLGRIRSIVRLDALSSEQLKTILVNPEKGIILKKQKIFLGDNIYFEIDDDAIDVIVDKIVQENLGARSIENVVDQLIQTHDFYMFENDYNFMKIDKEVILNGTKPKFYKLNSLQTLKKKLVLV